MLQEKKHLENFYSLPSKIKLLLEMWRKIFCDKAVIYVFGITQNRIKFDEIVKI